MHIEILISPSVITPPASSVDAGVGALATFTGTVRGSENDQPISALVYEAYQPMAETVMHRLLTELAATHPCHFVFVQHRTGTVPVGEAAIHIAVQAKHRAPAFALLAAFMDRLKQDVPIWKTDTLPA
ncbi:molybdopterin synthase catalytic subunit [Rariglobus hedericola]|uniref:Molybdopterin synthase catalytic subunit n=1 Tax=Rariglobus hedericola TaxID=2597822 RepID=A0A556QQC3_9BACT|nr:molybdenum cofactor biosynthesis protein MoaE [Rariglobus hedericola]TSJ78823.1 molybdenum cofactor biosynthesis protein MoaE [Rariglobus hedericola]